MVADMDQAHSKDPYELLEVPWDANLAAIRAAYRMKSLEVHPDKGGNAGEYALLQEAYSLLSNSKRRQHFDETGRWEISAAEELSKNMGRKLREAPEAKPEVKKSASKVESKDDAIKNLPPALRAAVQGRTFETKDVPTEFLQPVPHMTVSESREGVRSLKLMDLALETDVIKEGEVLVQMQAMHMSLQELNVEETYQIGDTFGSQGIGVVRVVGSKVPNLSLGDWVIPLREVDEDGDLAEDAKAPGTGRAFAVYPASRLARVSVSGNEVLSVGQMGVAKSIGTAYRMVEEYTTKLDDGESIILNAANGVIGQVLVQLLCVLKFKVFAVVRDHEGVELTRRRLEKFGAAKVFVDGDNLRAQIDTTQTSLPQLALDAVGGEATARLASTLRKKGDIVCYGVAGGSRKQVLPPGWGKKWQGNVHQFSFDEWLQEDLETNSGLFSEMLLEASKLMQCNRFSVDVKEYAAPREFNRALEDAKTNGRTHAVVMHFGQDDNQPKTGNTAGAQLRDMPPELQRSNQTPDEGTIDQVSQDMAERGWQPLPLNAQGQPFKGQTLPPGVLAGSQNQQQGGQRPLKKSWDLDFLKWDEDQEEDLSQKRLGDENRLFKVQDKVNLGAEQIQKYVDDPIAMSVAMELGASRAEAGAVVFWLPGENEVPEEHGPWLQKLCDQYHSLRVLVLKPKVGFKWYDMTDNEVIKMGLRFGVLDDIDDNMDGEFTNANGDLVFPQLEENEIDALQQIESAAIGLARRALLEAEYLRSASTSTLRWQANTGYPFFFGGFGQGGSVALFTALCLMPKPIRGVSFTHSAIPVAAMLGKRLTESVRASTKMFGVYEKVSQEIPAAFPEAIFRMFKCLDCNISLDWVEKTKTGDGDDDYVFECSTMKAGNAMLQSLKFEFLSAGEGGTRSFERLQMQQKEDQRAAAEEALYIPVQWDGR
mmetsp:Transcript_127685/g.272241  ORF Transcript_127685/g.272241 Transcript_127685/m.272241 type:complete len:934 (-) Transcript_127685:300-3101(-)